MKMVLTCFSLLALSACSGQKTSIAAESEKLSARPSQPFRPMTRARAKGFGAAGLFVPSSLPVALSQHDAPAPVSSGVEVSTPNSTPSLIPTPGMQAR